MKKYCVFPLALALILALFAGCGCTNRGAAGMPTDRATVPGTGTAPSAAAPTSAATERPVPTQHTAHATEASRPMETEITGSTGHTEEATADPSETARGRMGMIR